MMTSGFSPLRAMRLLMITLEVMIALGFGARVLSLLRSPAWTDAEGRAYAVFIYVQILSFPLLVVLVLCGLLFSPTRRFALRGLGRSLIYLFVAFVIAIFIPIS